MPGLPSCTSHRYTQLHDTPLVDRSIINRACRGGSRGNAAPPAHFSTRRPYLVQTLRMLAASRMLVFPSGMRFAYSAMLACTPATLGPHASDFGFFRFCSLLFYLLFLQSCPFTFSSALQRVLPFRLPWVRQSCG